jgi:hypothetical protein
MAKKKNKPIKRVGVDPASKSPEQRNQEAFQRIIGQRGNDTTDLELIGKQYQNLTRVASGDFTLTKERLNRETKIAKLEELEQTEPEPLKSEESSIE